MHAVDRTSQYRYMPDHAPIEITIILRGGPPTRIDDIESPLERALCRAASYRVQRRLRDLRCANHHQRPRVTASGPSADYLTYSVEGCCPALIDTATARLG